MVKAIKVLLVIFVLPTFVSCDKSNPMQTMNNENISPTIAATPTEPPQNKDITDEEQDRVYYRTAEENREYYENVESRKNELYSIETQDYIFYYDGFFNDLIYAVNKAEDKKFYFLNGNCIFIMTDNEIEPTYEETGKAGEATYQSFKDMIYNEEIAPFSDEVGKLISDQIDKILSGKAVELPANYYLLDYSVGDLNSDGQKDIAVVIEQAPGIYRGSRAIYILLQDKGSYVSTYENTKIVLGRGEGGVGGDPYSGISIENGELHIYDYGGSNFRWSHDYTFTFQQNELVLSKLEETNCYLDTMYGTVDYYDFINKTRETRAYYDGDHEEASEADPFHNLLLYSGELIVSGMIAFEDSYAWCNYDLQTDPADIRPDMGWYEYGQHDYQALMQSSPKKMLDLVKKEYYPDMKKVDLKINKEISDNYLKLIGYRIPSYYYTDGEYILCYYNFESSDGERYFHQIYYYLAGDSRDDYKFYDIWDDTGELVVTEE